MIVRGRSYLHGRTNILPRAYERFITMVFRGGALRKYKGQWEVDKKAPLSSKNGILLGFSKALRGLKAVRINCKTSLDGCFQDTRRQMVMGCMEICYFVCSTFICFVAISTLDFRGWGAP